MRCQECGGGRLVLDAPARVEMLHLVGNDDDVAFIVTPDLDAPHTVYCHDCHEIQENVPAVLMHALYEKHRDRIMARDLVPLAQVYDAPRPTGILRLDE